MNFKKMAEEVQNKYFERGGGEHYNHIAIEEIASALASAEKKGNELHPKERDTVFALGLQQGWNEAITAAVKVAKDWCKRLGLQFGCEGQHHGIGTKECPKELHHHHDDRCVSLAEKLSALKKGG